MSDRQLPWNRDEIFHDDVANYPMDDYMFLSNEGGEEDSKEEKEETGRF